MRFCLKRHGILPERISRVAFFAERIERRARQSVDRMQADQLIHVERFRKGRVLCSSTGPEHALWVGACLSEALPAILSEGLKEARVGEFGVRDRHLRVQGFESSAYFIVLLVLELGGNLLRDARIDSRDEEAGDAGNS